MLYCTRCGSNLKDSKVHCPVCGYEIVKMKDDISRPREVSRPASIKKDPKPWAPPIPDQRKEVPVKEERKEETGPGIRFQIAGEDGRESDTGPADACKVCGGTPVNRCFFTRVPLCQRHTVYLQVYVRSMPFGEKVPSAPEIASLREGKPPTQAEAEEAGMFFSIKPYHVWKRVR
ncbi:MAG: hypothetical protein JXA22_02695 [Candidatus Thermoplasmatota archaeon]|nr:hypothetical protein [Candidatus Thermoplasmatota archaeon]